MDTVRACALTTIPRMSNRALARLLRSRGGDSVISQDPYTRALLPVIRDDPQRSVRVRQFASDCLIREDCAAWRALITELEGTRQYGTPPDITPLPIAELPSPKMALVLFIPHVRAPFNGGNIIRTAAAYGITGVVFGRHSPEITHPRLQRAAMGGEQHVSVCKGDLSTAEDLLRRHYGDEIRIRVAALETPGQPINTIPAANPGAGLILIVEVKNWGFPKNCCVLPKDKMGYTKYPIRDQKNRLTWVLRWGLHFTTCGVSGIKKNLVSHSTGMFERGDNPTVLVLGELHCFLDLALI